jgi:hypothetical protein
MAKEISDQDIITGLQALESSLWKTLLENRSFDLDNVSALIRDPQYMAAVGIRGQYIDDIEFFRNPNEECHGSESPSLSDEELLLFARGDKSQEFMERFFSPRDLQCLRGTSDDSSKNIGPERVELVILLDRVDRLLTAILAIQKMRAAQGKAHWHINPARNAFNQLSPQAQEAVCHVLALAQVKQKETAQDDSLRPRIDYLLGLRPATESASVKKAPEWLDGIRQTAVQAAQSLGGAVQTFKNLIGTRNDHTQ